MSSTSWCRNSRVCKITSCLVTICLIIIIIIIIFGLSGCMASDPLTDTIYLTDFVSDQGTIYILVSSNVTTVMLTAENVTSATMILTNLPSSDPGIPGTVWSDNGTLKVSK